MPDGRLCPTFIWFDFVSFICVACTFHPLPWLSRSLSGSNFPLYCLLKIINKIINHQHKEVIGPGGARLI